MSHKTQVVPTCRGSDMQSDTLGTTVILRQLLWYNFPYVKVWDWCLVACGEGPGQPSVLDIAAVGRGKRSPPSSVSTLEKKVTLGSLCSSFHHEIIDLPFSQGCHVNQMRWCVSAQLGIHSTVWGYPIPYCCKSRFLNNSLERWRIHFLKT